MAALDDSISYRSEGPEANNHVRICVLFGPRVPPTIRRGMYLLLFIVAIQRYFYHSCRILLGDLLVYAFEEFNNGYTLTLLINVPMIFCSFLGLCCDLFKIRRGRLVHISLLVCLLSSLTFLIAVALAFSCFKVKEDYVPFVQLSSIFQFYIRVFLSSTLVLFVASNVVFLPISVVYGLDILFETTEAARVIFLALNYIAFNVGGLFSYLQYVSFRPEDSMYHVIVMFIAVLFAFILFSAGRCNHWLDDSIIVQTEYSFCASFGVICQALGRVCTSKLPKDVSFLHLASSYYGGSYSEKMVVMVRSMLLLHLNLFMLLPFFGIFFSIYVLFPQQSSVLNIPGMVYQHNSTCHMGHNENTYLSSLIFLNALTIVLFIPFFEYVFYGTTLGYKEDEFPWFINCISRRFLPLRVLQSNLMAGHMKVCNYFSIDSIMKRMYWGLSFAIAGVVASLVVENLQINANKTDVTCLVNSNNPNAAREKYVSDLSIFSQVPQYVLFAMFESVTIVGSFQFILYQCNKYFRSSLKAYLLRVCFTVICLFESDFLCWRFLENRFVLYGSRLQPLLCA